MILAAVVAVLAIAEPPEELPVDAVMAAFEAAIPELRAIEARSEDEIGRLGSPEPGWAASGMSPAEAIALGGGTAEEHVLGEWEAGGHGVTVAGDHPLSVPPALHRYTVRSYEGPIDYHSYHRFAPGLVIHTFGAASRIGNAACRRSQGVELIAQEAWRDWPPRMSLQAFAMARATRDDRRIYCMLYRPAPDGRFGQVAFTPEGRPYVSVNLSPQAFAITSRAEAAERIFSAAEPPAIAAE